MSSVELRYIAYIASNVSIYFIISMYRIECVFPSIHWHPLFSFYWYSTERNVSDISKIEIVWILFLVYRYLIDMMFPLYRDIVSMWIFGWPISCRCGFSLFDIESIWFFIYRYRIDIYFFVYQYHVDVVFRWSISCRYYFSFVDIVWMYFLRLPISYRCGFSFVDIVSMWFFVCRYRMI